ncbi:MAG: autotransporter-associated beta strand repeat-containing protein, partial [Verrucomicrobiota bacterium]
GADFAYMDAAGTFVRAPIYGTDSGFTTAGTITSGTHVKLTSTPAAQSAITLNTLNLAGSGVGFPQSGTLTLANNGILKSGGGAEGEIIGGTILPSLVSSQRELVVRTDASSDLLKISSPIGFSVTTTATITTASAAVPVSSTAGLVVGMDFRSNGGTAGRTILSIDNGTNTVTLTGTAGGTAGAQQVWFGYLNEAVTKSGAGTLTLSGANLFGGGVNLNAGQLNINSATALGAGFFVSGAGVSVSRFTINEGTTIDNTSGNDLLAMSYKYTMTWNGSFTFLGTNDLSLIDPSGNGTIYMPRDVTVTVNAKTLKIPANFSGTFSGSQSLNSVTTASITKNGPGALWIGSNGDAGNTGGLIVNNGVLVGPGIGGGQSHALFSGPVALGDATPGNANNATIEMYGPTNADITHTAPITVRAGSTGTLAITADNNGAARKYLFDGPLTLNNNLTLSAVNNSSNSIDIYGVVSGTGTLNIGNTGTFTVSAISATPRPLTNLGIVTLWRANTYSGSTVVNSGTLKLGAQASINSSPVISLAAGTTLDLSQTVGYTLSTNNTLTAKGTGTGATAAIIKGPTGTGTSAVNLGSQAVNLTFTPTITNDTTAPSLYVSQGSLALNNNAFTVTTNSALGAGVYRLIQVGNGTSGVITQNASPSYPVTMSGSGLAANSLATISVSAGNVILTVVTRSVTSFSNLTLSETIQQGTPNVALGGTISAAGPVYPASGETIGVTINGVVQNPTVDAVGHFSLSFDTSTLTGSGSPYTITYSYSGNATLTPATDASTTLTVTTQTVPTISAWPTATSITYGQDLTSSTLSGDGGASVAGTFTFTTP